MSLMVKDLHGDDIVIALMGPTGVGKSTFIDQAARDNVSEGAGHHLASCTTEVRAVRVRDPFDESREVVFVDTPGFDDTYKSDAEVLKMIADWLKKSYEGTIKLAGIIYLHRISDNRMAGTPLRNLRMFGRLCGDDAIGNVILVTTMWGNTKEDVGARREQELKDKYWKGMLTLGSRMARFLNTTKSAWDIVGLIVTKGHTNPLLLQEELVDLRKRLSETQAAIVLYQDLQRYLEEQKETIKKLQQGVVNQDDEQVLRELTQQVEEIQTNLRNTLDQIQELKIPLGRRLASFFFSKKSRAKPIVFK